jgi:hypothetical protein
MRTIKLDKRFNGHRDFKYCAEFVGRKPDVVNQYIDVRTWCWDQWGPSCELDVWHIATNRNLKYCWTHDQYNTRVFFATEAEFSWFLLKWGS